ncbi:MAG TPA: hypothetical protein PLD47_07360 [Aggregatilineales bacterium]|nr:hypothetical protein [Anaerolineales bacterium]HRE47527.1 hypothetical protein [Aggregatilineales bacterium]
MAALQQARSDGERMLAALPSPVGDNLRTLTAHAESQKAVLGVLLTSATYKSLYPTQDIRYHQEKLLNGYSGRTFDTRYTTPFLKTYFPRYAMSESAWLTRSLEQPHPFTMDFPGRIQQSAVKAAFLALIDYLEQVPSDAFPIIVGLFVLLIREQVADVMLSPAAIPTQIGINDIVHVVNQHIHAPYKGRGASRLPVLALYALYRLIVIDVKRYEGVLVHPLTQHTAPDTQSHTLGDIELIRPDSTCFEAVEVKHRKPITADMVKAASQKIGTQRIERYYILTTHTPDVIDTESVQHALEEAKRYSVCQIIVNGVIPTLKYALRLVRDPAQFLPHYSAILVEEFQRGSTIKRQHIVTWQDIQRGIIAR